MTILELKLKLPDSLAKEVQAAGLLTSESISQLLEDAMRRRAGQALLEAAKRATQAKIPPLSMEEIQVEVKAVRQARKAARKL